MPPEESPREVCLLINHDTGSASAWVDSDCTTRDEWGKRVRIVHCAMMDLHTGKIAQGQRFKEPHVSYY